MKIREPRTMPTVIHRLRWFSENRLTESDGAAVEKYFFPHRPLNSFLQRTQSHRLSSHSNHRRCTTPAKERPRLESISNERLMYQKRLCNLRGFSILLLYFFVVSPRKSFAVEKCDERSHKPSYQTNREIPPRSKKPKNYKTFQRHL